MAEHAIALIFACARKVVWSRHTLDKSSAAGQWDFTGLFPIYRLDGKTLGIIGVGRIGSRVYRKLKSFGLKIIANDPYLSAKRQADLDLEFVEKETLFRNSDFVTIHTPLTDETRHLINTKTLGWMKPEAYVVNTSRGPMVDDQALADAVKSGRIAGAAIDVFSQEPPPPDHPFLGLENIILTPHIAWASEEAGWEIRRSIVNDILSATRGEPARCVVNSELRSQKE